MRVALAALMLAILAAIASSGQARQDLSGDWVLRTPREVSPGLPQAVSIQLSRLGAVETLAIERRDGDESRSDYYRVGIRSGTVLSDSRTVAEARWDEARLVIRTGQYFDTGHARAGEAEEREEIWQLESLDRLVLETTDRRTGKQPVTARAVYTRKP